MHSPLVKLNFLNVDVRALQEAHIHYLNSCMNSRQVQAMIMVWNPPLQMLKKDRLRELNLPVTVTPILVDDIHDRILN